MIAVERGTLKVLDFQATEEKGQGARIGTGPGPYAPGGWIASSGIKASKKSWPLRAWGVAEEL